MDLFRHVRIYFARFQALMLSHRSKEETHKYWTVPNDGNNAPSIYTGVGITADKASNERTENLVKIVKDLGIKEPRILEVGCNAGRNLNGLYNAGFKHLTAIEISKNAINQMENVFPETYKNSKIHCGPAEEILPQFENNSFDVVYTMAVLQHIHSDSINEITKEICRVSNSYLLINEAETYASWRHFPRSYRTIFSKLGAKFMKRNKGTRIFKK